MNIFGAVKIFEKHKSKAHEMWNSKWISSLSLISSAYFHLSFQPKCCHASCSHQGNRLTCTWENSCSSSTNKTFHRTQGERLSNYRQVKLFKATGKSNWSTNLVRNGELLLWDTVLKEDPGLLKCVLGNFLFRRWRKRVETLFKILINKREWLKI